MKRVFNLILIICIFPVLLHVGMVLVTEHIEDSRRALTSESKARLREFVANMRNPYPYGGDPAASALILNFGESEEPATIEAIYSPVFFDHQGQGRAIRTGWPGRNAGLLVVAHRADGQVENGKALMGNHFLNGDPHFQTGMEALARQDQNGDGLIDARDAVWSKLRTWRDTDLNGLAEENELLPLETAGLASISLAWTPVGRFLENHNYLNSTAVFTYADGREGRLSEIYFQQRTAQRRFLDDLTIPISVAEQVPDLEGSGWVRDLREAAVQNRGLFEAIKRFNRETRSGQLEMMSEIMKGWADTLTEYATLEERAAGRYRLVENTLSAEHDPARPQLLKIVEAFSGRYMFPLPHELYPGQELRPEIRIAGGDGDRPELSLICSEDLILNYQRFFGTLAQRTYYGLIRTSRLAEYFDLIEGSGESADFTRVKALFDRQFDQDQKKAAADLLDFRMSLVLNENTAGIIYPDLEGYIESKVEAMKSDEGLRALNEEMRKARTLARKKREKQAFSWKPPKTY